MQTHKIMNHQEVCHLTSRSAGWYIQLWAWSLSDVCLDDEVGSHRVVCRRAECRALGLRGLPSASDSNLRVWLKNNPSAMITASNLKGWQAWVLSKTNKRVLLRVPWPWRWPRDTVNPPHADPTGLWVFPLMLRYNLLPSAIKNVSFHMFWP